MATQPNIVVIMTDDQTAESLTQMSLTSPPYQATYSNLILAGTTFLNSYVTTAICQPSRAAFLTGQYSHNNGVVDNSPASYLAFKENNTLAIWLKNAGYQTGIIGKYLNAYTAGHNSTSKAMGWDEWYVFYPGPDYFNYTINNNGVNEAHGNSAEDYSTDVLADEAVKFIKGAREPFFLWLTLNAPHDPFTPPPRYAANLTGLRPPLDPGINERSPGFSLKPNWVRGLPLIGAAGSNVYPWIVQTYLNRLRTLMAVDDAIGQVMKALEPLSNTYVFFTSDNGYMRGQHRIPYNKTNGYDPSAKVPLVVVGPGVLPQKTRSELVLNIDLTATIMALSGASTNSILDGQSLLPLLTNPEPEPTFRTYLMTELVTDFAQVYPVPTGPNYTIPAFNMLRTADFKYMKNDMGEEELYDMAGDQYEINSLHNDSNFASTLGQFRDVLWSMKNCYGTGCIQ